MKILENTIHQMIMRTASAITVLLATIFIARHFGLFGYGDFIKITTYVGLFYLPVDFGLNAVFLQKTEKEIRFRDLLFLRIVVAIILIFAAICISFFLPYNKQLNLGFSPQDRIGIIIFSLTILAQAIVFSSAAIFQKKLRYDLSMKAGIIGSAVALTFVVLSIVLSLPLSYALGAFVLGGITTAILSLLFTKEIIMSFSFNFLATRKLLRESLPLGIMLVFNLVYFKTDVFLLSILKPASDVGIYGLSRKFFEFLIVVPLFLSNALYPTLLERQRFANFFHDGKKYLLLFITISFIVLIPFWFLSPLISLIKPEFSPAVFPLRILLIFLPFFFATSILQWILIAQKKQAYLMYVYIIATIANVFLNLIFIPKYSYIASAIITGVVEAIVSIPLFVKVFLIPNLKKN